MSESKKIGRPATLTSSAKKRKKSENDAKWNQSRINVGREFDRWIKLKNHLGLKTHSELATVLLDCYEATQASLIRRHEVPPTPTPDILTSTPAATQKSFDRMSEISDISTRSKDWQSDVSGCEIINGSDVEMPMVQEAQGKGRKRDLSDFVDPFEMTIEISDAQDMFSVDDNESDIDYEPSINITIGPANGEDLEEITLAEAEFGQQEEREENEEQDNEPEVLTGVHRILSSDDQHQLTDDEAYIVYLQSLLRLATLKVDNMCRFQGCGHPVDLKTESVGSAVYIKWVCQRGHLVCRWCSQPVLNRRLHGGDLLLSAAVLLSGNNFTKLALFAKFLKLHFVSASVFLRIQRTYLVPTVDTFWQDKQSDLLADLQGKQLVVLGDGRMDSPGHCAQYCSYTMMDDNSKKIVSLVTLDKRQSAGKSCNLEKLGFQKVMAELRQKGCVVSEVVTDAHMQISSIMKKDFPNIKHSHDIWHAAKNVGKKIIKAGQEKQCKDLLPWTQHVTNHFWHTAQTASTYEEFIGIWFGVVHHVTNEHQWALSYGRGESACSHGPISGERDVEWLKKGSPAHKALVRIVMDKRLMNNIPYYLNCRSTAELENFQNLILMYAAKRFAYTPPVYRARNLLAAMDYNEHVDRPAHINIDGTKRYKRMYNKKSSRWTVMELKTEKTYDHIPALISKIVSCRLDDDEGMQGPVVLEVNDPRRISRNIAPVPPPPTKELVLLKKSRIRKEEASIEKTTSEQS